MSVAFWSDKNSSVKYKKNFLIEFPDGIVKNTFGDSYKHLIKSCTRPKATANYKQVAAANFNNYAPTPPSPTYPLTWNQIQIKFVNLISKTSSDPLTSDITFPTMFEQVFNPLVQSLFQIDEETNNEMGRLALSEDPCAEVPENSRIKLTKTYFGNYIMIHDYGMINNEMSILGTWFIQQPWITDLDFGSLDYSSDDQIEMTISFGYLRAEYIQSELSNGKLENSSYTPDLYGITETGRKINAEARGIVEAAQARENSRIETGPLVTRLRNGGLI
jgi:hypothetical protein